MKWWMYGALGLSLGLVIEAIQILTGQWLQVLPMPGLGVLLFLLAKLLGDALLFFWRYDLWVPLARHALREHVLFAAVGLVTGVAALWAGETLGGNVNLVFPAVLGYLLLVSQVVREKFQGW